MRQLTAIFAVYLLGGSSARQALGQAGNQPPAQTPSSVRTYTASGTLTTASRTRLKDALAKVPGVEQIEFKPGSGIFTVRITGTARANAVGMAGMAAGFDFRPATTRTFELSGSTSEADIGKLCESLQKAEGIEQVDTLGSGPGMSVRVQGETRVSALVSISKSAGYELRRSLTFAASGSPDENNVSKLREAIGKVAGVAKSEVRPIGGGATLSVQGAMDEDDLMAAARSTGYGLKSLPSNTGNRAFSVLGVTGPADEEKLRKAVQTVSGIGEVQVMTLGDMTRLGVRGGTADPEKIVLAAVSAGFAIEPVVNPRSQQGGAGEQNTPPAYDERVNEDSTKVGDLAPDFDLVLKDGKQKIKLSSYRGKKPVVLIFGSYTWPPFRTQAGALEKLYQTYKDRVEFLMVYIREAHPDSILFVPTKEGGKSLSIIPQTFTVADRLKNLEQCVSLLQLTMPALIDSDDNSVNQAYAAWPDRLYAVGTDGKVAFKTGPGPFGFRVSDLDAWLQANIAKR